MGLMVIVWIQQFNNRHLAAGRLLDFEGQLRRWTAAVVIDMCEKRRMNTNGFRKLSVCGFGRFLPFGEFHAV